MDDSKKKDTQQREHLELKVNKGKAKIFREIGFMVKKLYRATREEYKERIKGDLEDTIEQFNRKLDGAKKELDKMQDGVVDEEEKKDEMQKEEFLTNYVDAILAKFDEYDSEHSPVTIAKLIHFRDEVMSVKIAAARAEVEAGLLKKERSVAAAYEAVKMKISKIEDHHFQYNVRTLLEDAKAEADQRCAHEEDNTGELIDDIEEWVWDFVQESTIRYNDKVKAEREALAAGLAAAADRLWEGAAEDQEELNEHQEHEKHALEYFLKDCVKGLKHLFNRYGYVSPSFQEPQPRGGVDASEVVDTLGPDPDNIHKQKELHEREKAQNDSDDDELESWKDQGAAIPTIGCMRGDDGMCECQKTYEITNKQEERVTTC